MARDPKNYMRLVAHYESCLEKHGDTHLGVDWPNKSDAETRYRVMLGIVRGEPREEVTLLDFGCGASHLYEYITEHGHTNIHYAGLDLSEKFIHLSQSKFPGNKYYLVDILEGSQELPRHDYIVMNGVFTEKRDLPSVDMLSYLKKMLVAVFPFAGIGIAFNVMSKHVDWQRDDLFYLPFDTLANFLTKHLTRNFIIRNDYGLYEYTTYIYK